MQNKTKFKYFKKNLTLGVFTEIFLLYAALYSIVYRLYIIVFAFILRVYYAV